MSLGCRESILTNLSESEANRVLARLETAGFEVKKNQQPDGRWALNVDRDESSRAISFLERARAMPLERRATDQPSGWLVSRAEQQQRMQRKIAESLEETLYSLDRVREARVHLNMPERDPLLGKEISPGSASVLLITEGSPNLSTAEVAKLVAGAAGLKPEQVSVLQSTVSSASEQEATPIDSGAAVAAEQAVTHGTETHKSDVAAAPIKAIGKRINLGSELALTFVIAGFVGLWSVFKARRQAAKAAKLQEA